MKDIFHLKVRFLVGAACLLGVGDLDALHAAETEYAEVLALPAPGPVLPDGRLADWDRSAGVLLCGDVERTIDSCSVWIHVMYDSSNLYLLGAFTDLTPLNNPIPVTRDDPWEGDMLQFHLVAYPEADQSMISSVMAWRHTNTGDRVFIQYGADYHGGEVRNALTQGARQGLATNADQRGYVHELTVPWKLLTPDGRAPAPGMRWVFCIQAHFSDARGQRTTLNDIVQMELPQGRPAIWKEPESWGEIDFRAKGTLSQSPPVRLAGGREFAVKMKMGFPVVDWQGFVQQRLPAGLASTDQTVKAQQVQIEQWITQLGAADAVDRKTARIRLREAGYSAVSFLEARREDPDPEIRCTVREILQNQP